MNLLWGLLELQHVCSAPLITPHAFTGEAPAPHVVVIKSSFVIAAVPSFAKINLGLRIGALRRDGFHGLRTVYQTIALHDTLRISVERGTGIEIRCDDPRVPTDSTNTCYKIIEHALELLKARGRVVIEIEKHLPVQAGLGGASGNAVSALLGLERLLRRLTSGLERLRIAAEVGSDLPLFLIGGTVLGVGRGEEVYPLPDLPAMACVIALPEIAVSTPKAFADWDELSGTGAPARKFGADVERAVRGGDRQSRQKQVPRRRLSIASEGQDSLGMTDQETASGMPNQQKLKNMGSFDRMSEFSREISAWLSAGPEGGRRRSGVSAGGGGRAENPLLDLVRTGIENDFEKVVFPQHPELREVKRVLERAGAVYASLSGSGSAVYGLFESREKAAGSAERLRQRGIRAVVTSTLTRRQYWKKFQVPSF
jgi:4-diphosphocytidyl-2-C-methyl-D-erythritol kinase